MEIENYTFEYETVITFDEKSYRELLYTPGRNDIIKSRKMKIIIRSTVLILFIFVLLLFKYTIALGVLIAIFLLLGYTTKIFDKKILKFGARSIFNYSEYLHEEITYGVNDKYIYIRSENIEGKAKWKLLKFWRIYGDWIQLNVSGMPQIFLNISEMKHVHLYEIIFSNIEKYGYEYNKPRKKKTIK